MKEFLLKHRRILILGLIVAIIFAVITALSADRSGTPIKLTEFITRQKTEDQTSTFNSIPTPTPTPAPATSTTPTTPPTYPVLFIQFIVGTGWTPGSKNGHIGQKVIWKNESESDIVLMELFPKTSAIANGVTITPGGTAEIMLSQSGLFTYRELNSQSTGRIFVVE